MIPPIIRNSISRGPLVHLRRVAATPCITSTSTRCKTTVVVPYPELDPTARSAAAQKDFGKMYDKKPFKFLCEKGKAYLWCACGHSKSQPFCDKLCLNTHYRISMRPVKFLCPETKEYWFCNCKQTAKRPFCDGTHRREDVVATVRV